MDNVESKSQQPAVEQASLSLTDLRPLPDCCRSSGGEPNLSLSKEQNVFTLAHHGDATDRGVDGVVTKVDAAAGKITIRHGDLPHYEMEGPMTMVFRIDQDMLKSSGVKAGDGVRFDVERVNGQFHVTKLEKKNARS